MHDVYRYLLPAMWLGWAGYWWLASHNVKASARRESLRSRLLHIVPLTLAVALLWLPKSPIPGLGGRFLPAGPWPFWLGAVLTLAGLLFTVWARVHLGRNWSAEVVVKEGHALVRTGPYRYLRHPIYTGLLVAFLGTAITIGEWRGLVAFLVMLVSLGIKSRAEEARMRETFPEYAQYQRESAAIVPFIW